MKRGTKVFVLLLSIAGVASAQTPWIESHFVPDLPGSTLASDDYVDIPGTEKSVTLPAGTAIINWSIALHTSGTWEGRIRPVLGLDAPPEGMYAFPPNDRPKYFPGSWSVATTGGPMTVRLQAKRTGGDQIIPGCTPELCGTFRYPASATWTLTVFPAVQGGVPAVSTYGLIVLSLVVLGGGSLVIRKREVVR